MSQYVEGNHKTFTLPSSLTNFAQYSRVTLSSGVLALAGIADKEIGVVTRPPAGVGASMPIDVLLRTSAGTTPMVAAGAITAGSLVYTAANGQVSTTSTSALLVGIALNAASGAGSVIEVLRSSAEA